MQVNCKAEYGAWGGDTADSRTVARSTSGFMGQAHPVGVTGKSQRAGQKGAAEREPLWRVRAVPAATQNGPLGSAVGIGIQPGFNPQPAGSDVNDGRISIPARGEKFGRGPGAGSRPSAQTRPRPPAPTNPSWAGSMVRVASARRSCRLRLSSILTT